MWPLRAALALAATLTLLPGTARADSSRQYVSGYACDPAHGQPYCGYTASGVLVGPGMAACPPSFDFGTRIVVHFPDGDYTASCQDRGPRDHWDLFWPTTAECYARTGWFDVEVG